MKYFFSYLFFLSVSAEIQLKSAFHNKESVQTDIKAHLSQKAILSCEVADAKTGVKWYKDGKLLTSSKTIHTESKGKSRQLLIESVEKKDAGEYICEAESEKLSFKIQVQGMKEEMLLLFSTLYKYTGTVMLYCYFSSYFPLFEFIYRKSDHFAMIHFYGLLQCFVFFFLIIFFRTSV